MSKRKQPTLAAFGFTKTGPPTGPKKWGAKL